MFNLLIAVPVRPSLHAELQMRACQLVEGLLCNERNQALFHMDVAWFTAEAPDLPQDAGRWCRQAWARNALVDEFLHPIHDLVLWVDADLVDYPADLPALLHEANPGGVTAPMVFIEGTRQFYDTLGFIQDGRRISPWPPYWHYDNGADLVECESVGTAYLIPADILRIVSFESLPVDRKRDRVSIWPTGHTDHWPVMQAARAAGIRVACLRNTKAWHADLPGKYGERWH